MSGRRFLILAVLAACAGLPGCEQALPVSAADKEVVLRAADLIPFGYEVEEPQRYEKFNRTRHLDGSGELSYEYETPDTEKDHPLYINVTVTVERSKSDAWTSHGAEKVGLAIGLGASGVEAREIEDFYEYGDTSSFSILEKDGRPIGNLFTVREGRRVFVLMLSGMYFDDAAAFRDLIEQRLKKFSAYSPG